MPCEEEVERHSSGEIRYSIKQEGLMWWLGRPREEERRLHFGLRAGQGEGPTTPPAPFNVFDSVLWVFIQTLLALIFRVVDRRVAPSC